MSKYLTSTIFGYSATRKASFRDKSLVLFICKRNPYRSLSVSKRDKKPRILVVGSGWGGYRCAMDLDKEKFQVQLISPRNHFLFTPLLPSTAVGTLEFRAIQEPARVIPGIEYFQASLSGLDLITGTAHCIDAFAKPHKFKLEYDAIVLAPGSETNTFGVKGVTDNHNVFFLKQLQDARGIRNRLIECFERASSPSISEPSPSAISGDEVNSTMGEAERERLLTFVVVGGGPTSVEFSAELYDFLESDVSRRYPELYQKVKVILVEASGHILGSFHSSLIGYVESVFKSRRIEVITGRAVREIDEHIAVLSDGRRIPFGMMVWSTGVKQVDLIRRLGEEKVEIEHNESGSGDFSSSFHLSAMSGGRLKVDSRLRVIFDSGESSSSEKFGEKIRGCIPAVFALGDCAANDRKPLPMLAQVASQQGSYIAAALNKHGLDEVWKSRVSTSRVPDFNYAHLGAMASIGEWKGVYDSTNIGTDSHDISGPPVKGFLAFLLWRAAYWTKQVSLNNKILILLHWFKSAVFGRDISRF